MHYKLKLGLMGLEYRGERIDQSSRLPEGHPAIAAFPGRFSVAREGEAEERPKARSFAKKAVVDDGKPDVTG